MFEILDTLPCELSIESIHNCTVVSERHKLEYIDHQSFMLLRKLKVQTIFLVFGFWFFGVFFLIPFTSWRHRRNRVNKC